MKNSERNYLKSFKFTNNKIIYFIIYMVVFTSVYIDKQGAVDICFFIGSIGATSGMYLIVYFGLKLNSYKLKNIDILRKFTQRLNICSKEIIIHICIFMVALLFNTINDTAPYNQNSIVVEYKKVDVNLINKIEESFGRTDIDSIVKINDDYIITFSDNSKKFLKGKDE